MRRGIELPEPSATAQAHSALLSDCIRHRIRDCGGWLDFAEFMDLVLYAPALGYYSAGAAKLGQAGDFVTAPEISPVFARCMARAVAPALVERSGGVVLELGAGTGALAAELLVALGRLGASPERYLILEVSADLRERQRETLARLVPGSLDLVRWLERLPERPVDGVVLANEVADALPVSRFTIRGGRVHAAGVIEAGQELAWGIREADEALAAAVARLQGDMGVAFEEGYTSEISLRLPGWIAAVAAAAGESLILIADYGASRREYYHPQRRDGTLRCHYRHRAHDDVFLYPGLQDITAWVDFSAVADSADAADLQVAGYATQGHFLLDTGFGDEMAALDSSGAGPGALQAAKRLLLPGEMGERFKVIALSRGVIPVRGFAFRDLRHLL